MSLIDDLRDRLASPVVVDDPDICASYGVDWTGRHRGPVLAVVRAASTADVVVTAQTCLAHGAAMVPQGGNTSLVGGSVPIQGSVVVSLTGLDAITDVDPASGQMTTGAGVTLASAQAAAPAGWRLAVDLAARDRATIGGMIATNAGGALAARFGSMRRHVVGIEAVRSDGAVLRHLAGHLKDNTGYDLAGLLCGSEGTLAIVTAARLRCTSDSGEVVTAWARFETVEEAVATGLAWFRAEPSIEVLELLDARSTELIEAGPSVSLLLEARGHGAFERVAHVADGAHGRRPVEVAGSPAQRAALWARRDGLPERIRQLGVPIKADVAVAPNAVPALLSAVPELLGRIAPGAGHWCFGHLADGNVHVNVIAPAVDPMVVGEALLRLAVELGGTISAEHGIGREKVDLLHLVRSREEIETYRALRRAMDPAGLLNPGVLVG